jgi:putative transposase
MKEIRQNRACLEEKKAKIKESKKLTSLRRKFQVCKVFECKIVEKRLNKK